MKGAVIGFSLLLLSGCSTMSYYAHLAQGQYELLSKREPIAEVIADPARDPKLRERLTRIQEARRYAVDALHLPDNASYTKYSDLKRPFVVWNVFAAGEFSVKPLEHCFWIVGCLAYRGYFNEDEAKAEAARLQTEHYDTHVAGIPAYSTLGWFDDPVINTMMNWTDEWLIGTLFHELSHQLLYLRDDTAFNESFASFVEEEGLRQYLAARGISSDSHHQLKARQKQFVELVLKTREQLSTLYASGAHDDELRRRKAEIFAQMRREYEQLRDGPWQGWKGYERWFAGEINNAKLVPFALYDAWIPAFAALYRESGSEWQSFYAAARKLGELDKSEREQRLKQLLESNPEQKP